VSGICGWIRWDGGPVREEEIEGMLRSVAHRGPDGQATWAGEGAALGHLALSITPESLVESQPLEDRDTGLVLVADARIDNRVELIPLLRGKGELQAESPSDAELILAAYRAWGPECPVHLVGDFAFAIWSPHRRLLFLARDPMGMRSLHFRTEARRFLFGTEVKQILAAPGVPDELHLPAIAAHLQGGFGSPEWTFQNGIMRLPPGNALVVEEDRLRRWRYWTPDPEVRIRYRTEDQYVDHFLELFKTSVGARLRSVHPAGLLLSGGVDSGAIAAAAGALRSDGTHEELGELRAYSFAWDALSVCDERHISGPLAKECGLPVTEIPADDAWPLRIGWEGSIDADTPFLFGHYVVLERTFERARRDGIRLMLSGDRGDLVAGMNIFDLPSLLWTGRWPTLIGELRTLARWRGRSLHRQARREGGRALRESAPYHRRSWGSLPPFRKFGRESRSALSRKGPTWLSAEMAELAREAREEAWLEPVPPLPSHAARERYRMIFTPLHMLGVEASERMHARHGQAFADPWSDRRIAEFVCQIPQRTLNQVHDEPKRLTRRAMAHLVPEHHVRAMRKIVPTPLFDRGLREKARPRIEGLLEDVRSAERGFVDPVRLRDAYRDICGDPGADSTPFWRTLTLELWLRMRETKTSTTT
jgi:asparagine synthase (glutamine-hydrolysing)